MSVMASIIIGAIWTAEMWWRGWAGLHWISRFHASIVLASVVVASLLQSWSPRFQNINRFMGILIGVVLSVPVHLYFGTAGYFSFIIGPSATPLLILGDAGFFLGRCVGATMFFALPILGYIAGRVLKIDVHLSGAYLGLGILMVATLFLPTILGVINHPGSPDLIHSIKSGLAIPFLLFSFLAPMTKGKTANKGAVLTSDPLHGSPAAHP